MITTVSQLVQTGVYHMRVIGAHHCHDFDIEYDSMDAVWAAARKVSEKEANFLTRKGKGWGP